MRAAKPSVSFDKFTLISTLRAPRRPVLALTLCGAAALTFAAPLAAQTAQDITLTYSNGATTRDANPASWGPNPNTGTLTLHVATGAATETVVYPGPQNGAWVKTGSGQLAITSTNEARTFKTIPASIHVAEGALIGGGLAFGKLNATSIQIDAGALFQMTGDGKVGNSDRIGSLNGAGTVAILGEGESLNGSARVSRGFFVIGPLTSNFSGHIGATISDSAGIVGASTATDRAASDRRFLFEITSNRFNFSGTTSDVSVSVGSLDDSTPSTLALNGAVLGEATTPSNGVGFHALYLVSSGILLIEGDSRVNSMDLRTTADLGNSKLEIFGDNLASAQTALGSTTAAVGVLKGGAASVLRKTGQSSMLVAVDDTSAFLGAVEVAGGDVTIARAVLADDNTLTITTAGGRTGKVLMTVDDRVGAIKGDAAAGALDIAATKTLQVGGAATDLGVNTFAGALTGTGNLEFLGRHNTTILTGTSTLTGAMAVNAGKVVVNGTLPVAVSVGNGGTLAGNGTVGTVDVASGGKLSVSNVGGPLRTGNVTLAAGSTFDVQLDPSATAAGNVIASAGTIALNGAKLHLANAGTSGAAPTLGFSIAATGGLMGTFGQVTDDYAFFDARVVYGANDVNLLMARNDVSLGSVAGTPNQSAAARGLDGLPAGSDVLGAVMGLPSSQVQAAYDSLSGEVHADVQGRAVAGASTLGNAALDHLGQLSGAVPAAGSTNGLTFSSRGTGDAGAGERAPKPQFWGTILASASQQSRTDGFAAANASTYGLVGGLDFATDGPWKMGALIGASRAVTAMSDRASDASTTNAAFGVYGGRDFGGIGLGFGLLQDIGRTDATRRVSVGGLNQTLTSSYDTRTTLAFAEIAGKIPTNFGSLTPFLRLTHAQTMAGGFSETGGSAALSRAATTTSATIAKVGLNASANITIAGKPAVLTGGISYQDVVSGSFGQSVHGFAAGGNAFSVGAGLGAAKSVGLDLGLKVALSDFADLSIDYAGTRASGIDNHQMGLSLKVKF